MAVDAVPFELFYGDPDLGARQHDFKTYENIVSLSLEFSS
jgi:hypothetical protein